MEAHHKAHQVHQEAHQVHQEEEVKETPIKEAPHQEALQDPLAHLARLIRREQHKDPLEVVLYHLNQDQRCSNRYN